MWPSLSLSAAVADERQNEVQTRIAYKTAYILERWALSVILPLKQEDIYFSKIQETGHKKLNSNTRLGWAMRHRLSTFLEGHSRDMSFLQPCF